MVAFTLLLLVAADLCLPSAGMTSASTTSPATSPVPSSTSPPVVTTPSTVVTQAPVATQATTTSTDPPLPTEGVVELVFNLNRGFTGDLADPSSQAYKNLVSEVLPELNRIGKKLYGEKFLRSIIKRFRRGSVIVDSSLVFADQSSVPDSTAAKSELTTELTASTSLDVVSGSVNANSLTPTTSPGIVQSSLAVSPAATSEGATMVSSAPTLVPVESTPATAPTTPATVPTTPTTPATVPTTPTTPAPTTPTTPAPTVPTTAATVPTTATTAATVPTTATTAAPTTSTTATTQASTVATTTAATTVTTQTTTAATDPPTAQEGTMGLQFSLNETFTVDLSNPSSAAYQALAAKVLAVLNRIGKSLYASVFKRAIINAFTNGSVVVNSSLVFTNQSVVPTSTTIQTDFETELRNTTLTFIPGTASAFETASGASHNTVGSLMVFSLAMLALVNMLM